MELTVLPIPPTPSPFWTRKTIRWLRTEFPSRTMSMLTLRWPPLRPHSKVLGQTLALRSVLVASTDWLTCWRMSCLVFCTSTHWRREIQSHSFQQEREIISEIASFTTVCLPQTTLLYQSSLNKAHFLSFCSGMDGQATRRLLSRRWWVCQACQTRTSWVWFPLSLAYRDFLEHFLNLE